MSWMRCMCAIAVATLEVTWQMVAEQCSPVLEAPSCERVRNRALQKVRLGLGF